MSGGGAVNATPYIVPLNFYVGGQLVYAHDTLALTSSGNNSGSFVSGGSLAQFDGYWTASFTFYLPANASGVQLNYGNFWGDDRAVLELNGTIFSSTGLTTGSSSGSMVFTDGGTPQPYAFSQPYGQISGTVTSGFNVGGMNTLEAIVNNTGDGLAGTMSGALSSNDGTTLGLTGAITYTTVPEPSFAALLFLGLGSASLFRKHQGRE